jgi:uroporphyrinogen decarboxylase
MTNREAVLQVLSHKSVHPVPYFLDMTDEVRKRMIEFSGDEQYFEHSGSYLAQERNESFTTISGTMFKDMFSVVWDKRQEGDFGVVADYPIKQPSLEGYVFPEPDEKLIREKCERLVKQSGKFTMYIIGFSLFERAWTLYSMEELLCAFITDKDFVHEMLDRITDYNLAVAEIVCQYPIDCIFFGDDWGQQQGLIMGYPLWKEFIRPRLKRMYNFVKSKGKYAAQHSCGDCRELFPDLVDLGLDIYNTFQPEVYNIIDFKERFGKHITFFGGISTQRLLPYAAPGEIKAEMRRITDILSRDGGYIIAPTHAMPADIPSENVQAFLEFCQSQ